MTRRLARKDGRIPVRFHARVPEVVLRSVCDFMRFIDPSADVALAVQNKVRGPFAQDFVSEGVLRNVCEICAATIDRDYGLCIECMHREDIERNGPVLFGEVRP